MYQVIFTKSDVEIVNEVNGNTVNLSLDYQNQTFNMKLQFTKLQWLAWFIGFADAEGNFQVFPKKRTDVNGHVTHYGVGYHFHIGLATRDLELLEFIKSQLGDMGKIYTYPHKDEVHWAIFRKADIVMLLELVFEVYPLLTVHQASRYNQLRNGLLNNVTRFDSLEDYRLYFEALVLTNATSLELLDQEFIDSWIIGFINGEGSFSSAAGATGGRFYIEHIDKRVIDLIKARLDCNPQVQTRPSRDGRKVTYALTISTARDLNTLIQLLNSNPVPLQGYKLKQYNNWLSALKQVDKE